MNENDQAPAKKEEDVVFVHSSTEAGDGLRVVRKRGESLELGELRGIREGQPIHGDVVKLVPREGQERVFDVEVLLKSPTPKALPARTGPAQVATTAYRANWESIFGREEAPN
jgi:hypothetical protein